MEPYGYYPIYTATVDYLEEANPDALFADGLEAACIGHTETWHPHPDGGATRIPLAVYSKQKVIQTLMEQEMTLEEAEEYADFNIYCAYMGENTPLFIDETYPIHPQYPTHPHYI